MAKTAENVANVPVQKPKLTAERAIAEIRSLRAGGLFVGNMEFVDKLLEEYDQKVFEIQKQHELVLAQSATIDDLQRTQSPPELVPDRNEPSVVQEGVPS